MRKSPRIFILKKSTLLFELFFLPYKMDLNTFFLTNTAITLENVLRTKEKCKRTHLFWVFLRIKIFAMGKKCSYFLITSVEKKRQETTKKLIGIAHIKYK